jgi:hypothetical protein
VSTGDIKPRCTSRLAGLAFIERLLEWASVSVISSSGGVP